MVQDRRQKRAAAGFRYVIMHHLTEEGGTPQEWDAILTPKLREGFRQELSVPENNLLKEEISTATPELAKKYEDLAEKLDEFILYQARTLGWRIILSELVHWRMAVWVREESGPKKFERLGRAMARSARVLQGQGRPLVTAPGWYGFKKNLVPELKLLFQQIADFVHSRRRLVTVAQLLARIDGQIRQQAQVFPYLLRQLDFLREYLSNADDSPIDPLRKGEKVSASQFFDLWMAWRTRHQPEKFRQKISAIGRSPRKPTP
jgi:hypothetical protein